MPRRIGVRTDNTRARPCKEAEMGKKPRKMSLGVADVFSCFRGIAVFTQGDKPEIEERSDFGRLVETFLFLLVIFYLLYRF